MDLNADVDVVNMKFGYILQKVMCEKFSGRFVEAYISEM